MVPTARTFVPLVRREITLARQVEDAAPPAANHAGLALNCSDVPQISAVATDQTPCLLGPGSVDPPVKANPFSKRKAQLVVVNQHLDARGEATRIRPRPLHLFQCGQICKALLHVVQIVHAAPEPIKRSQAPHCNGRVGQIVVVRIGTDCIVGPAAVGQLLSAQPIFCCGNALFQTCPRRSRSCPASEA